MKAFNELYTHGSPKLHRYCEVRHRKKGQLGISRQNRMAHRSRFASQTSHHHALEDSNFALVVALQKLRLSSAEPLASLVTHPATDRKQVGQTYAEGVIDQDTAIYHTSTTFFTIMLLPARVTRSGGVPPNLTLSK